MNEHSPPQGTTEIHGDDGPDTAGTVGTDPVDPGQPVDTGGWIFDLPVQADVRAAADIHTRCRAALEATGDVGIRCGDVERLDGAVLQCLVSLHRGLAQGGRRLDFIDPSPAFERAVSLTGAGSLLGLADLVGP